MKNWNRKKKEALIAGNWELLPELAKKKLKEECVAQLVLYKLELTSRFAVCGRVTSSVSRSCRDIMALLVLDKLELTSARDESLE